MSLVQTFAKIKTFLLDLIFPIECLGCGKEDVWLCEECFNNIPINQEQICPLCKRISLFGKTCSNCQDKSYLDGILIASHYKDELLQKLIPVFKYKFVTDMAEPLGELLVKLLKSFQTGFDYQDLNRGGLNELKFKHLLSVPNIFIQKETVLMPIPLHKKRLKERGFNQAELLAKQVSKQFNWQIENKFLKRKHYTSPQAKLSGKEREENMRDVFECLGSDKIINTKIILIDDVMTTGATMQDAARTLKNAGAKEVWGLALAHG